MLMIMCRISRRWQSVMPTKSLIWLTYAIRMSELNPNHSIVTTDRQDFNVYRRNKRETIPPICPPER